MREIKFRGRVAPRGKQWFYGELDTHTWGVCILDKNTLHTVISETVGQYTGLKDATGKEIYEGDIIKTCEGDVGVIVWETELGGFRARLTDDSFYTLTALFASMLSVIGNVHDNPELLEATVGGKTMTQIVTGSESKDQKPPSAGGSCMSYLLSITLDGLPPTVNHLYRTGGRHRYKTAEGAAYQEATAAEMRAQREMLPVRRCVGPYLGPVALHIIMTSRTRRRWDLDNRVKAVQDCLQMAGIIKDDSQITELVVRREALPKLDRTRIMVMTREEDE